MKTKLSILTLAASGIFLVSCNKDHDIFKVDPTIDNAFRTMYASATRAEWKFNQGYYVVDFWQNGVEAEAWFDSHGTWQMTETDVKYADLPAAVRAGLSAGEWAGLHIDDIDKLEYPGREIVYIIEVEKAGVDYDLWFSPDGVLVKAVADNSTGNTGTNTGNGPGTGGSSYGPSSILPAVRGFMAQKYPGARIIDIETGHNSIEVDIVDGRTPREVVFTPAVEWSYTETEIRQSDVPATVLNALAASQYGSWRIDDVSRFETPAGEYYLFEVESGNRESRIKIDIYGNIL